MKTVRDVVMYVFFTFGVLVLLYLVLVVNKPSPTSVGAGNTPMFGITVNTRPATVLYGQRATSGFTPYNTSDSRLPSQYNPSQNMR